MLKNYKSRLTAVGITAAACAWSGVSWVRSWRDQRLWLARSHGHTLSIEGGGTAGGWAAPDEPNVPSPHIAERRE